MIKPLVIADMKFKQPGKVEPLRNLLKYLQFRDGSVRRDSYLAGERYGDSTRSDYVRPEGRDTRWVDRGMGESYSKILNQAWDLQGKKVLARTWVISPDPEMMQHLPDGLHMEVTRRVVERTMERWYGDNSWGTPEYSYVIHDKHRRSDNLRIMHAHIVTPGTIPIDGPEGARIDHYIKRPHLVDLQRTANKVLREELELTLGQERAAQILREREARLLAEAQERQRTILQALGASQPARHLPYIGDGPLGQLHDVLRLIRLARRGGRKSRPKMRPEYLILYARMQRTERRRREREDRQILAAAQARLRERAHQEALTAARAEHAAQVESARRRPPTYEDHVREMAEEERILMEHFATQATARERRGRHGPNLER